MWLGPLSSSNGFIQNFIPKYLKNFRASSEPCAQNDTVLYITYLKSVQLPISTTYDVQLKTCRFFTAVVKAPVSTGMYGALKKPVKY